MNLPQTIRDLRKKKKMSQSDLAGAAGLSTIYIGKIETGKQSPTLASLQKIADGLDIPFPILSFLSLDDSDVDAGKKEAFQVLAPAVHGMIREFFVDIE